MIAADFVRVSAKLVGVPVVYPGRLGYRPRPGIDHVFIADHRKRFARQTSLPAAWVSLWNGEEEAPADVVFIGLSGWEAMWWISARAPAIGADRATYIDLTGTAALRADPDRGSAA